jgi:hypothetical protein
MLLLPSDGTEHLADEYGHINGDGTARLDLVEK